MRRERKSYFRFRFDEQTMRDYAQQLKFRKDAVTSSAGNKFER